MGLSLGGTQSSSNANATNTPSYTSTQSSLQTALGGILNSLLGTSAAGGISPNVQAMQTQNADTINQSYNGLETRMNSYLASRGMGSSGQSGKAAMDINLGREGALAQNNNAAAGQQLNLGNTYLSDALQLAFANPGSVSSGTTTGSSSGWGATVGGGVGSGGAWGLGA